MEARKTPLRDRIRAAKLRRMHSVVVAPSTVAITMGCTYCGVDGVAHAREHLEHFGPILTTR
jgi:hypothetical protein